MSRVKELEERVQWLERQVYELKKARADDHKWFEERYHNVNELIEKYVEQHIWYTTNRNMKAFKQGERVRVVLEDLKDILGD